MEAIQPDQSLTDRVYEAIRESIIVGGLSSGELYSVAALADQLNVSRTPVREALLELSHQGMVEFERNRGVRILRMSLHDIEEIFSLRLVLETTATARAAAKIDDEHLANLRSALQRMQSAAERDDDYDMMMHDREFHRIILNASGNGRLMDFVDQQRVLILTRGLLTTSESRSMSDVIGEHQRILEALETGDAKAAVAGMRDHILETGTVLISQTDEEGDRKEAEELCIWAQLVEPEG